MAGQVWFKQGVVGELCREMRRAVGQLSSLYATHGADLFITSVQEGNHSAGSLHYDGRAIDCRKGSVQLAEIKAAVGFGFDCISESDHFHIEWDPKD
jgi:hypothetical protein